jgi:hypothetical protein
MSKKEHTEQDDVLDFDSNGDLSRRVSKLLIVVELFPSLQLG